ncbi:MAG TPA: response regulator [Thermoanaerobaculia bacterium]|nr:response regulator [Thermoanaerobaculia bacterium]
MARILLIEDEPDTRELVRLTLELDGHDVEEAATAEEGIVQARQQRPDLILMDLSLAGKFDGLEATKRLRADPAFDQTPIIALTAHAMQSDREKSLAAGCDDHWTKPIVDLALFKSMIGTLAARGRDLRTAR